MSTTNKILKTAGVAIGCDVVAVGIITVLENEFNIFDEDEFNVNFLDVLFSTVPALGVFGIDKFVNQNITSNKTIQYGLTAAESVLAIPTVISVRTQENEFTKYFQKLSSPSFKGQAGMLKIIAANKMIQSLAFKYIWDSSDEKTHELDQTDDLDLNLDALNISTDFGSL